MNKILKFISDALFPQSFTCDLCGIETFNTNLCPDCLKTVEFNDKEVCPVCGRKNSISDICFECKAKAPLFKKGVSPLVYQGGSAALIAKFKNGNAYLKDYFADLIAEKLKKFPYFDCIVYVPMTEKAVYARGYNQAELLAKSISARVGVPVIEDAVIKQKDTPEQKTLSRKEREKNLKGCFKVKKHSELKYKYVLLVDDVLTTGATSEAICKLLLNEAAIMRVCLATIASVDYKMENEINLIDNPS